MVIRRMPLTSNSFTGQTWMTTGSTLSPAVGSTGVGARALGCKRGPS